MERHTHASEVLPTPGGPKTSVTCPRRIPARCWSESSRAVSRRARPVLIGSRAADEALRDCEAEIETTGAGSVNGGADARVGAPTRVLAVETEQVLVDAHGDSSSQSGTRHIQLELPD